VCCCSLTAMRNLSLATGDEHDSGLLKPAHWVCSLSSTPRRRASVSSRRARPLCLVRPPGDRCHCHECSSFVGHWLRRPIFASARSWVGILEGPRSPLVTGLGALGVEVSDWAGLRPLRERLKNVAKSRGCANPFRAVARHHHLPKARRAPSVSHTAPAEHDRASRAFAAHSRGAIPRFSGRHGGSRRSGRWCGLRRSA
jgi:hypothetical protein